MPTSRPMKTQDDLGEILGYYSDIEELWYEMVQWKNSIPEYLQDSDKYQAVEEAEDTLDRAYSDLETGCSGILEIVGGIPRSGGQISLLGLKVEYTENKMYKGYNMPRWVRLANPCAALEAAMRFIEGLMDNISELLDDEEKADELKRCIKAVDDGLSELENVDFPPMYG